jgi:hypothetical protein
MRLSDVVLRVSIAFAVLVACNAGDGGASGSGGADEDGSVDGTDASADGSADARADGSASADDSASADGFTIGSVGMPIAIGPAYFDPSAITLHRGVAP